MADSAISGTASWFPVVTTLLGFITAGIFEWLRDNRTSERERRARDANRQAQLLDRRATFQRETLINLQDAVARTWLGLPGK